MVYRRLYTVVPPYMVLFVLVCPTLRFAYVGLLALRASCLTTPPCGHPSKGGEWAVQGIMFQYIGVVRYKLLTTNF